MTDKYLKYKQKYLELKNQLESQNQLGSGEKFINAVKSNNLEEVRNKLVHI